MNAFQKYADYYDVLYEDKDYEKECDFVETIFKKYAKKRVVSILDLGCGTGSHGLILAKRGYKVTGIDLSATMIDIAKNKAKARKVKIDFKVGDMRRLNLNKKFDAIVSMFAAMGYQTKNDDLSATFLTANRHLKRDGILIFDCWFGPAVLFQKPRQRTKVVRMWSEKIIRHAKPVLDIINQTVDVNFKVELRRNGKTLKRTEELHRVRFFFVQEIKHFLEASGFRLLKICPFSKIEAIPSQKDWNISVIAQKV